MTYIRIGGEIIIFNLFQATIFIRDQIILDI